MVGGPNGHDGDFPSATRCPAVQRMKAHIRAIARDGVVLLALALAGWNLTYGLQDLIDIGMFDEGLYLYHGVTLLHGLPGADAAPLYAVWYFILSLLQPDRAALYYLNYKLMTVLPVLLLYLVLRRYKVGLIPATVIAFFFLIESINLPVWPKVSHFSVILILASFYSAS